MQQSGAKLSVGIRTNSTCPTNGLPMAHCGNDGGIGGIYPPQLQPRQQQQPTASTTPIITTSVAIMGKTTEGLAREGPPPQKPPVKTQFDFHTRHLLHTLSQHLPGTDPATTEYATLSEENARLVRRTVGRAQRALERRQERKKKSKSTGTAADALEFYRHATVKARKMKGLDVDEEEDLEEHELLMSDSDSEEDEEEEEESSSEEEEESSEEEESCDDDEDDDDDKNDDSDDEESAASITSEEFLSAHNDLCEVCSGVGDDDAPLLCCATCTLVFHQRCHRPLLVKEPPDNWSCAYCDDSGVTLHKRDSRERKRASKGVREMKKMMEEQAERERAEATAARAASRARAAEAASAAAASGVGVGGGGGSPSKSSAKTPPKPAHNIRDPETGRFMTKEKRLALYGSLGVPPKEALEGQGGEGTDEDLGQLESSGKRNDLSDLTPEEIARLASGDGNKKEATAEASARKEQEDEEMEEKEHLPSGGTDSTKLKVDAKQDGESGMTTPTQSGPTTPKKEEADNSAIGEDDEQSQAQKNKQQLKGAELKLLLGAMSPEEVDISGPRARRQQRKAPSLYDPGDMAGDMHWSSKKEAEARSGQRAPVPPGSKKRKRELLSDVLGRNKKSKSSASGEKSPKKPRTSSKGGKKQKKAKNSAKQKKKKVCCCVAMELLLWYYLRRTSRDFLTHLHIRMSMVHLPFLC